MKQFWYSNNRVVDFIPVNMMGYFNRGKIMDNVIDNIENLDSFYALAIIPNEKVSVVDVDAEAFTTKAFRQSVLENLKELCVVYHTLQPVTEESVILNGRFKLIFKMSEGFHRVTKEIAGLRGMGVEIAWGGMKPFTVLGHHRSEKSIYRIGGGVKNFFDIQPLNEEIIDALCDLKNFYGDRLEARPSTRYGRKFKGNGHIFYNVLLKNFEILLLKLQEMNKGDEMYITKTGDITKIICNCPINHSHSSRSRYTDFSAIYFHNTRVVWVSCYHTSCNVMLGDFVEDCLSV